MSLKRTFYFYFLPVRPMSFQARIRKVSYPSPPVAFHLRPTWVMEVFQVVGAFTGGGSGMV